jgi:hypothetical protein
MSKATAIVLSATPFQPDHPGWKVLNYVSTFKTLERLHFHRLQALLQVTTEFCAFVDSDDELPENTASQIEQIVGRMEREHANLTYTDWIEKTANSSVVRRPGPYNWAKHITSPVWMHQLVVMRTSAAQELAKRLPHGLHWTEFLLYAPLAQKNPIYWPEVGYIWHKGETGMHCHEHIAKAQQNSVLWYLQKGRT